MPPLPVREKNLNNLTIFAASSYQRIKNAFAAMGDLLVQGGTLCFILAALDTSDHIAGGTAVWICGTDTEHFFRAVFIFPAIHRRPPFEKKAYRETGIY
jgi:hypothetical protein